MKGDLIEWLGIDKLNQQLKLKIWVVNKSFETNKNLGRSYVKNAGRKSTLWASVFQPFVVHGTL
jgi:hypothetical protein